MVVCNRADESSSVPPRRTTAVLECSHCRRKFLNEADRALHVREAHLGMKGEDTHSKPSNIFSHIYDFIYL